VQNIPPFAGKFAHTPPSHWSPLAQGDPNASLPPSVPPSPLVPLLDDELLDEELLDELDELLLPLDDDDAPLLLDDELAPLEELLDELVPLLELLHPSPTRPTANTVDARTATIRALMRTPRVMAVCSRLGRLPRYMYVTRAV
jgi:hypothetical protein